MAKQRKQHKRHYGTGSLVPLKHPRGTRWRAGFYDQHSRRRFRTGKPGECKSDAEKRLRGYLAEVDAETYLHPGEDPPRPEGALGFREFAVDRFLKEYTGRCGLRSKHYDGQVRQLIEYFGDTPLLEIDRYAIDRYRKSLEDDRRGGRRLSPETIRKRLVSLGTALGAAYTWGLIDSNPAHGLKKPPADPTPFRKLSRDEWRKLLQATAAADDRHDWELPLYRLALATVCRLKEITHLRWDDVHGDHLYLRQFKIGGRLKKIPVGRVTRGALKERERFRFLDRHVFAVRGSWPTRRHPEREETWRRLHENHVSKTFLARLRAAGIGETPEGHASFHSIRATAASWLADDGFSELQIGTALGHKLSQSVTQRYVRFSKVPEEVVAALDGYQLDIDSEAEASGVRVSV